MTCNYIKRKIAETKKRIEFQKDALYLFDRKWRKNPIPEHFIQRDGHVATLQMLRKHLITISK